MADLDYARLGRVLARCEELGSAPDAHPSVRLAFTDLLSGPAAAFRAKQEALVAAETRAAKEAGEAKTALSAIDGPYGLARSVVQAYVPHQRVPDSLTALRTDTDKRGAIAALLDVLDAHADEPWAKLHLEGEFGALAPDADRELLEWSEANVDLSKAKRERAEAYGPAWEQYISFKNIVRRAYGPKSKQYRRIHVRFAEGEAAADATPSNAVAE